MEALSWFLWGVMALCFVALWIDAIRHDIEVCRERKRRRERLEPKFTVVAERPTREWWADRPDLDMSTRGGPLRPGS